MVAQQEAFVAMMKGKRTKRSRSLSPFSLATTTECNMSSVEWAGPVVENTKEEEDMAHCLILLAQGSMPNNNDNTNNNNSHNNKGVLFYECKTCNKSFPSFQALGGHRASHKKAKKSPIFFSLLKDDYNHHNYQQQYKNPYNKEEIVLSLQITNEISCSTHNNNSNSNSKKKAKVHECGICGVEFSSGQALGGHMRRHKPIGGTPTSIPNPSKRMSIIESSPNNNTNGDKKGTRNFLSLDLNLPAPEDDHHHRDSRFVFPSNEKTLVFSTPSLVDCHY